MELRCRAGPLLRFIHPTSRALTASLFQRLSQTTTSSTLRSRSFQTSTHRRDEGDNSSADTISPSTSLHTARPAPDTLSPTNDSPQKRAPSSFTDLVSAYRSAPKPASDSAYTRRVPTSQMLSPNGDSSNPAQVPAPVTSNLPPLRLNSSVGRSILIDKRKGVDLRRGFDMLRAVLSYNRVRSDMMRQRFHERPGLKRKRLKSERWRKGFKKGFQQTVYKVQEMRKQGW